MANSVGEGIMQLIMTVLNAGLNGASPPLPTVRNRTAPMNATEEDGTSGLNAFLLYAVREESGRRARAAVVRKRTIRIEIPVKGAPPLDSAADPLYLYLAQALFYSQELANACTLLEEVGLLWETVNSYEDVCICALELNVTYVTTVDPAAAAMQNSGL